MEESANTPVREIELEGYKVLQYHIECHVGDMNFLLNPVFPTSEYINAYFNDTYKTAHTSETQTLKVVESLLGTPARSITWVSAPLQYLFSKNPFLTKEPYVPFGINADSFNQMVNILTVDLKQTNERLGNLYPAIKKLAHFYKKVELSVIYADALTVIDIKLLDEDKAKTELLYMDFLEDAMANLEEILYRNVGIGSPFSLFENDIRLFNIMFRKQSMFNNRIFAYDRPRIIRTDDVGLDRLLTPLFIFGWAVEPAAIYPQTPQQFQELLKNLLKEYLSAQVLRVRCQREDMARHKQEQRNKRRGKLKELSFSELIRENEDGELNSLEASIPSYDSSSVEQSVKREELKNLVDRLQFLTPRQQEVAKLYLKNLPQREIAKYLGIHETAVHKHIKKIKERLKKHRG